MLNSADKNNRIQPAGVVREASWQRRAFISGLWCFGWDMDNAKARCWYQHRIPLIHTTNQEQFSDVIQRALQLAAWSLNILRKALKSAWFETPEEAKVDFGTIDIAFWQETENAFRDLLDTVISDPEREQLETCQALRRWEQRLCVYLFTVFDREILTDPDCPDEILLRQLMARRDMAGAYFKQKVRKEVLALGAEPEENQKKENVMLNSDTAAARIITHPEAQQALCSWFTMLSERYNQQDAARINGRVWRAELRRTEAPYGVMACAGYDALRCQLAAHMHLSAVQQMALALFVSVAVHIKCHQEEMSFAAQLGEKRGDKACLSSLRFMRLQQAAEPETFCQQLIHAVRIRGAAGVNIVSLADSIFLWMDEWDAREQHKVRSVDPFKRNRIRWANEYLSTAK